MSREAHVRFCEGLGGNSPGLLDSNIIEDGRSCILQLRVSKTLKPAISWHDMASKCSILQKI